MSVQTNVNLFCKSKVAKAQAIVDLTKELKRKSRETVRTTLMPLVGKFWTVKLIDGEGKAKGSKVFDSSSENYENAKRDLYDLVVGICGKASSSGSKEPVAVPKKLLSNMTAEIIDAGLTRDEFNALLSQLRDAVSFQ
jgi:hypothetical protein